MAPGLVPDGQDNDRPIFIECENLVKI